MKRLGVFAKYWEPGQVKTRLAADLDADMAAAFDAELAAELHRLMLATTLRRLSTLDAERTFAYWPPKRQAEMADLAGDDWHLLPQGDGDLGERMASFFAEMFAQSRGPVVLLGSDSPTLPLHYVVSAFAALQRVPVAIGPSDDGGYYLLGLAEMVPEVFADIDWSTPQVLAQTQSRLQTTGREFELLPAWYDVDDMQGLERLMGEVFEYATLNPEADHPWCRLAAQIKKLFDLNH
ncbi:MAG: glycosyltransferase [Planctomycetota bacterium]|nr:MAG: glycosyltransferase [Planctomycetota bacterium]REJ87625.1 MAG: glycosyltransferase [Planctomycetota bacterium]REK43298.1 MAG: glycosyltransferase [Planctomycetota bacterium]